MKSLAIFGATGSVGKSALRVYEKNKKNFNLVYLSAHTNYKKLALYKKKYNPKKIILTSSNIKINNKNLSTFSSILKNRKKIDFCISGVSGFEALHFNLKLLKISKKLLIANKETIICGGKFFLDEAKKNNCEIIPIDSEHYCIDYFFNFFKDKKLIEKVYIIASGGPFLRKKIRYNENIRNVLNHPTWKMGNKIMVDSSNLSNKVMELFEAKILFNIPGDKLKILIENTSKIHAIIELKNKMYFPIMHVPNMQIPIAGGLNLNNKFSLKLEKLKIELIRENSKKFPVTNLGYKILKLNNHSLMIFFTVFNEKLVKMYLENQIKYGDVINYLLKAFKNKKINKYLKIKIKTLKDVFETIDIAKNTKII